MQNLPETHADYGPFLTLYYEEEIMGEAAFLGMREIFKEPRQREALTLLSRIERQVAESVRPLLERHGLTPRDEDELHTMGLSAIDKYWDMSWHAYMVRITETFPKYLDEFAALARVAPQDDVELLEPFFSHEEAGIEFAERELAGDPNSTEVLNEYLESFELD